MDSKQEIKAPSMTETIPPSSQTQFEAYAPVQQPNLWKTFKSQVGTKEGWWGDFDWISMCVPSIFLKEKRGTPFWGLNSRLPIGLALVMGFQHSLAMVSGVVTPILIMAASLNLETADRQYLLSAALITSAILSLIQITRFKIWRTGYFLGTGLLSVVGPNFASIPAVSAVIKNMYSTGYCATNTLADGSIEYLPCPRAWGAILGTAMVCSFFEIGMSFLPPKTIRRLFPPIVSGTTILLIGCSVISTALEDWAGGSGSCMSMPETGYYSQCPNIDAPHPLPWGSPQFLGLGFVVFATIVLIENIGSPFMKSAQIIIGLIVGLIVAAACGYVDSSSINSAPPITFLWTRTFPIDVYGPAIIPFLIVYLDNMLESIGDITASCDVSGVEVDGPSFQQRIQGGLLADGVNSFLAACMTISPVVTFAQNNGVVAMTRCANRLAGYCACLFIFIFGIFGKISAVFLAIPSSVLGGMNAFLFASVTVSGIRILSYLEWTRRDRFIVTCSLALGLGVTLVPSWFTHVFTYSGDNAALKGFLSAITTIVDTGYCIGSLMAIFLNLVIPTEWGPETAKEQAEKERKERDEIRDGFINSSINEENPLQDLSPTARSLTH
ncbi:permease family-domain-containing protein [Gilbertella persicaria]|uniref:permease family-domain-containing protein n=1 Tax=Gilbertella persicaria TaxID=101096 RepID=UPI00221E74F9|nr:permease family-domain-containing protein [Gilbertella persicaria]KAI8084293.1 permease family-domain-containing protein [Gilbertella persicaria]